ncbi:serine hydrolase [Enterococcus sp. DIV0756]|uniref:serine hydrolase n=1 Tax=Enterococcus sp. DIV0756 TaxID=2774636 RepID=UPI003F240BD5
MKKKSIGCLIFLFLLELFIGVGLDSQNVSANQVNETVDSSQTLNPQVETSTEALENTESSQITTENSMNNRVEESSSTDLDNETKPSDTKERVSVNYQTKADEGWLSEVSDGAVSGIPEGSSLKGLQAIKISLKNTSAPSNGIVYESYSKPDGWAEHGNPKKNGEVSGDTSYIEAIRIHLIGEIAETHWVYYRVQTEKFGWLGWAKNNEDAGTIGYDEAVRGIQIQLIEKGKKPSEDSDKKPFSEYQDVNVKYKTHVESIGWQEQKINGEISGATGQNKRIEGIQISVDHLPEGITGGIRYRTHVESIGWQNFKENGDVAGTTGLSKRIEAVQIELTGKLAQYYDVYYQVFSQSFDWLGWAKNGEKAGTEGFAYRLEGLKVLIVKKGQAAPGSMDREFIKYKLPKVSYRTHIQSIGWQGQKFNGQLSGTTGQAKRLEAIQLHLSDMPDSLKGGIQYRTHVQNYGWQGMVSNGSQAGTTGQAKRLEAIQISLTGEAAKHYDIYYRTHCQTFGWLGWAKNGENSGTEGFAYRLEGIQVVVVKKGAAAPGSTNRGFVKFKIPKVSYQTHIQSIGWQGQKTNGQLSGTTGQAKRLEAIRLTLSDLPISLNGGIQYKTHVQSYGWQGMVSNGAQAGTTGQAKRLEAIQINLTGDATKHYDIYYRTHCQNFGWLGWARNGGNSGTEGFAYRLEAIQIVVVRKGTAAPGSTANAFKKQVSKIPQVQNLLNKKYRNGSYGIYVLDLKANQTAAINGTTNFTAASTAKLPNIYYTQKLINEGKVSLNRQLQYTSRVNGFPGAYLPAGAGILPKIHNNQYYSLNEVLKNTIRYSDNVGSNFLGYYISNSYNRTFINEINRVTGRNWTQFSFQASAKDNALLMKAIYQLGGVSNQYLTNTVYDDQRIPKYLPVKVGHKVGDVSHYRHDVAIVYAKNPYILSVMTKNYTSYETISLISRDVYNLMK